VSVLTTVGFVVFDTQDVTPNARYFICAHSNAFEVEREWNTEHFEEISSCSNGFIFDTVAPQPGHVYVHNTNGFLTARQDVTIHWDGFKDNVDPTVFGYPSSIRKYYISCGKCITLYINAFRISTCHCRIINARFCTLFCRYDPRPR